MAVLMAQALQPDIILLDLAMPWGNGLEALQRLKTARPETKIIIATVHAEDAYRQAAEASGADAGDRSPNALFSPRAAPLRPWRQLGCCVAHAVTGCRR